MFTSVWGTCPGLSQQTCKEAGGEGRTRGSSAGACSLPWSPQEDSCAGEGGGKTFSTKEPGPGGSRGLRSRGYKATATRATHSPHISANPKPETTSSAGTLLLHDPSVSMSGAHLFCKIFLFTHLIPTACWVRPHHLLPKPWSWLLPGLWSPFHPRFIFLTCRADHVTALLKDLPWLPITY